MTPSAIYRVLTKGAMRIQAAGLSDSDKRAVAGYLAGKLAVSGNNLAPPRCSGNAAEFEFGEPPAFLSWGLAYSNTRYVPDNIAGISARNIGQLKLKWALGIAGATRMRSHPALAGGAIYMGSDDGTVYALDRRTGCVRWMFQAAAEVRTAIIVASWTAGDRSADPLAYFGDLVGNVYAVSALTGKLAWTSHADDNPATTLTGSPVLYKGQLFVPVSSLEENNADPKYNCCTFRGSIIAYDALSGHRIWKTYMMEPARVQSVNSTGTKMYGPSGSAVWNAPALDEKRGLLYFGTGDNYSTPGTAMSDAVVAMDIRTGKIVWSFQARPGDAFNLGCVASDHTLCPKENGPDFDIGAAIILATMHDGRQVIVAGQKSGDVFALDPDTHKLIWRTRVGRGGLMGGVHFGIAAHDDKVFVPISDAPDPNTYRESARPGLYALSLRDGRYLWKAPNTEGKCAGRGPQCWPGIGAPPTLTDSLVLTGGSDGWLRAYDAGTGKVVWQYDSTRSVVTVGGGKAAGGSIGGGTAPLPYLGTLIVESGYGFAGRMPGNVLLVFGIP